MSEDSIIKKTAKKLKQHRKKAGALSIATLITGLQMVGALGPVLCSLPFVKDQAQCLSTVAKANQAAKDLHAVDNMVSEDGTPMPFEEVDPDQDGGQ